VIQIEIKRGEVIQFPQLCEYRDVRDFYKSLTRNGVEHDTDGGKVW
jgi:hypothetical protein